MSGHSKWATIKHKKGAKDEKKGKIFGKHAKLIEIAARGGSDPEKNSALSMAIENAKSENVPNDNIQRAVKKGSGEGKDAKVYEEILYEGYLSGAVAVIIEVLTDNRKRSVSNIRTIISKNGGNLGESGSVNWMFDQKGKIELSLEGKDIEEFELMILDSGADDFEISKDKTQATIITSNTKLGSTRDHIKKQGYEIISASLNWIANQKIEISDLKKAEAALNVIDKIEDDDDVINVSTNIEFSDEVIDQI